MACEEVREEESAGSPGVWWAQGVGANGGMRRSLRSHVFTFSRLEYWVTFRDSPSATLARFPTKVEEGRNVSSRGYPATTAFSSLNLGIGGTGCVIAAGGVHKIKPCSYGIYS